MTITIPVTVTDEQKLEIAKTFISALKNNDWSLMTSILMPEASWTLPGTSILSGLASGAEAIVTRTQSLKKFGVRFELKHILIGYDSVALSLHNTATRGDLMLDEQVAIVMKLKGDKIQYVTTLLSDVDGINQFFVPGII
ncbi:nuclear transport factor 2-like protein [Taibaiella soli]|uniref:Nuclear transport factor 2 family protein n=1 Tax=Taibaiella soli TaxID=1649169 RepID=A0A2W2B8T8_9BACT|nr:nuclear transport factor 2 family protein [Taibaiella soli]PZF72709.1 nuclear transport factor 2 family protein [Taibaiella soli]